MITKIARCSSTYIRLLLLLHTFSRVRAALKRRRPPRRRRRRYSHDQL